MRLNANQGGFTRWVTVFRDGEKEPDTVEVYIPGNVLEGEGYVIRAVTVNGKSVATINVERPLPPNRYDADGLLVEKVFGQVRIEIEECKSEFEDVITAEAA